jgi:acyl dehydratase
MKQTWILRIVYWGFVLALSIAFASAAVRFGGPIAAGMTIAAGLFVGYVVNLRVRLQEEADAEDRS